ncbi:vacuole membrane protein KMS1-like [Pyrus x bretschneideri]|uniref:vacuole membrane protein KMS1-like n=1 Tax=Pyrus x bretschneideri TaxID=225117 RepID=UPI00202F93D5|nr:vacuole membrane protein KMS1-like [Pyrus x bretschneideri]XP_048427676.1 vacuole membrane protein KMS1-like [Pyrus x bretschneideri]XP_048427677.1 vacuole membrane protein KMS1-like [Pyrus x bretschneideri]
MGSPKRENASSSSSSSQLTDASISGLHEKHQEELDNLTLTSQPFRTLKFFILAVIQYVKRLISYLLARGGWLMLSSIVLLSLGVLLITIDGPHEKHLEELVKYFQFGLWWVSLGIASSIGLGSGLHTFVLYLGPHIAFFTLKAMQCGRVDLKSAPYDTIQLKQGPSWLGKNCSDFGPPLFPSLHGLRVPLSSILPQVQLEAVLWGLGTAIGELPPYFISRAASLSGNKVAVEELDDPSDEGTGFIATCLNPIKRWLLSHSQQLNFFTILVLASVPNPLFDLAGIMCGQFGIPFWKFFLVTVIGKAIIKTHLQTVFIISVCNNQLLNWIENELIWVFSLIPGFAAVLPNLIAKIDAAKEKYLTASPSSNIKVNTWDFSFASIWNSMVWLMLMNFFVKIVNATAQRYLKKQQEMEVALLSKKS